MLSGEATATLRDKTNKTLEALQNSRVNQYLDQRPDSKKGSE